MDCNPQSVDEWEFYLNEKGSWSWRSWGVSGDRHSRILYKGIVEAMADAKRFGYQPGVSHISALQPCRRTQPR